MATVLVYVQRTPRGIHPASELALCVARDICTIRGATLTALASGDGAKFDQYVEERCGALGADQLLFVGPNGLRDMAARLEPKNLFAGWTRASIAAIGKAGLGPLAPRWVDGPPPLETLGQACGVIAGAHPWHGPQANPQASSGGPLGPIEAEYQAGVGDVPMPLWLSQGSGELVRGGGLVYVAPDSLEGPIPAALKAMGAHAVPPEYAANHQKGTLLWLSADGQGLPAQLAERPAGAQVIVLPGPSPELHDTWNLADWVLSGPWGKVVSMLGSAKWQAALR